MRKPIPEAMGSRLDIDVVFDADGWEAIVSEARVIAVAQAAYAAGTKGRKGRKPAACTVVLSSDQTVQDLNCRFRGKNKPTNVLSFPSPPPFPNSPGPGEETQLGDVIIARETVECEARDMGITPEHHVLHLVAHGLLHLLGFDHEADTEADRMERLETAVLHGLGIADPYEEKEEPETEERKPQISSVTRP